MNAIPRVTVDEDGTITLAPALAAISAVLDACKDWAVYDREFQDAFDRRAVDRQEYADRAHAAHEDVEEVIGKLSPLTADQARVLASRLWAAASSVDHRANYATGVRS